VISLAFLLRPKKPFTNKSGEVQELTRRDIRNMRCASKVLPEKLLKALPKREVVIIL